MVRFKHIFLFLLTAILMVSCSADADSIKVMSFNIRYGIADDGENSWENRREAVALMLQEEAPDCFGVQEAYNFQRDFLLEKMPAYKAIGCGRLDGSDDNEHMCVFWKSDRFEMRDGGDFWLSETPDEPSKGWDAKYPRLATWALLHDKAADRDFYIVNTHLDHKGVQARTESIKLVQERIASINPDNYPMILMGDFNLENDEPEILYFNQLLDNARNCAAVTDSLPSFNAWGQAEKSKIIDFIYYGGFASCKEFRTVIGEWGGRSIISDHNPIYAVLAY